MLTQTRKRVSKVLENNPLTLFFTILGLLLLIILLGNALRAPETQENTADQTAKTVRVVQNDETPFVMTLAQADTQTVITVSAQTSGFVSSIHKIEGSPVSQGQTILTLTDTASGDSLARIDQQIAESTQKNTREATNRQITIADGEIDHLIPKDSSPENWIARKQSEIAKWNARLSSETADLNVAKADIALSLNSPSTPVTGTLENILVSPGEMVASGTPLFTVTAQSGSALLKTFLPASIAQALDVEQSAKLTLQDETHEIRPAHLSSQAVENGKYLLLFRLSDDIAQQITDTDFYTLALPLQKVGSDNSRTIPIDAIHVARDQSFIFVVREDNVAMSKEVQTGEVFGNFVRVESGLDPNDTIILSRNIAEGDRIAIEQ